ncbi:MAG: nucleotidyltransferase family protein [Nitrospirae bacterium]|nr:nucleotidyltransferase family protein [Nitrospirota bacterium]
MSEFVPAETDILILVGGQGSRLKSISKELPKPLVPVNGRPFISILLNYLVRFGFKRIILCSGYRSEAVRHYLQNLKFASAQIYISEETTPLGTAGAIKNAEPLITSEYFIVLNGDSFIELDYIDFVKRFFDKNALALLALARVDDPSAYGSVEIDENGRINSYTEKKDKMHNAGYISGGVYMFGRHVLDFIQPLANMSLEYELFPRLLDAFKGRIYGYCCSGDFIDIGTPENYHRAGSILEKYL